MSTIQNCTVSCRCGRVVGSGTGLTWVHCSLCPSDEADLPDEAVFAMWDEAKAQGGPVELLAHPLYRTEGAPRWFQAIEMADEWLHTHNTNVGGLLWWLWRPLCNLRERQYMKGAGR